MTRDYLEGIGLTGDQIALITTELEKESEYRRILGSEHVGHIESIMRITDMKKIDLSNEDLLREKIRVEYDDMIPNYFKCQK
jgi:hypothetical protein